jgi:hypothetical protein
MKGKKNVDGEMGLIFIAYLFTCLRSVIGLEGPRAAAVSIISSIIRPTFAVVTDHLLYQIKNDRNAEKQNKRRDL